MNQGGTMNNIAKYTLDIELLKGAVSKWENIAAGTSEDNGVEDCPLCEEYHHVFGYKRCGNCPVSTKTGRAGCRETPYESWCDHLDHEHTCTRQGLPRKVYCETCKKIAQSMINFLQKVLHETVQKLRIAEVGLASKSKVYVVHAYRWGNRENHNYPVGVYSTEALALKAATDEESHRGGKYACEVYEWVMDEGVAGRSEQGWKTVRDVEAWKTN
jgi:hypothetical protein